KLIGNARSLGLLSGSPGAWLQSGPSQFVTYIEERIAARALARKERRFADADRIRNELAEQKILLEDKPDGTTEWRTA
ncbi:MAG TPA: cysteine--tRNA ligase, partial [Stellaceae bacterium]|nr:cysteine--tRNA ligase [Stellaceae bacterium]